MVVYSAKFKLGLELPYLKHSNVLQYNKIYLNFKWTSFSIKEKVQKPIKVCFESKKQET